MYLIFVTGSMMTFKTYNRVKEREETELASHSVISKVASVVFSEQKENAGHGILLLPEADNQVQMVRYSERFVQLLEMAGDLTDFNEDHVNEKREVSNCLENFHLCENPHQDSLRLFSKNRNFSFATVLQQAVNKARKIQDEKAMSDKQEKVEKLFTDNFYDIKKSQNRGNSQQRPGHKITATTLEITTHVLCEKRNLFLVTLKKPSLSRFQIHVNGNAEVNTSEEVVSAVDIEKSNTHSIRTDSQQVRRRRPSRHTSVDSLQYSRIFRIPERVVPRGQPRRAFSSESFNRLGTQSTQPRVSRSNSVTFGTVIQSSSLRSSSSQLISSLKLRSVSRMTQNRPRPLRLTQPETVTEVLNEEDETKQQEESQLLRQDSKADKSLSPCPPQEESKAIITITTLESQPSAVNQDQDKSVQISKTTLFKKSFSNPQEFIQAQENEKNKSLEGQKEFQGFFKQQMATLTSKTEYHQSRPPCPLGQLTIQNEESPKTKIEAQFSDSLRVFGTELASFSSVRVSHELHSSLNQRGVGGLSQGYHKRASQEISYKDSTSSQIRSSLEKRPGGKRYFSSLVNRNSRGNYLLSARGAGSPNSEELGPMSTFRSTSSVGSINRAGQQSKKQQAQQNQSKLFFFKCIHDLKHPTQAVKDEIEYIIQNAGSFLVKLKKKQKSSKGLKYESEIHAEKAARYLRVFTHQTFRVSTLNVNKINSRKQSDNSELSYISRDNLPLIEGDAPDKEIGPGFIRPRLDLRSVQQSFWELPIENFMQSPQKNRERLPIEIEEEEKKEEQLVVIPAFASRNRQQQSLGSDLVSSEDKSQGDLNSVSVDSEELEVDQDDQNSDSSLGNVSEKVSSEVIKTVSDSVPQKKDFSRVNREAIAKIQQSNMLARPMSSKLPSLSGEKLVFQSEVAQRLGIVDRDSLLSVSNKAENSISMSKISLSSKYAQSQNNAEPSEHQIIDEQNSKVARHQSLNFQDAKNLSNQMQLLPSENSPQKIPFKPSYKYSMNEVKVQKASLLSPDRSFALSDQESDQNPVDLRQFQPVKIAKRVNLVLAERRYLIYLVESHMRKRMKIKQHSQILQSHIEMMHLLLHDLMNLATLNSNTFNFVNEYFDFKKLVRKSFKVFKVPVKLKQIELKGPIFEQPLDRLYFRDFFGDENRYRQIIVNFLSNAIKFTPRNGTVSVLLRSLEIKDIPSESPRVSKAEGLFSKAGSTAGKASLVDESDSFSQESAPDKEVGNHTNEQEPIQIIEQLVTYQMIFRDSGCGISEENQKRLFTSYQKVEETQESNKQGVGLGLSICRDIVNASGGSVSIQSQLGKGTDFIILLQAKCRVNQEELEAARARLEEEKPLSQSLAQSTCSEAYDSDEYLSEYDKEAQNDHGYGDEDDYDDKEDLSSVSENEESEEKSLPESGLSTPQNSGKSSSTNQQQKDQSKNKLQNFVPKRKRNLMKKNLSTINENENSQLHSQQSNSMGAEREEEKGENQETDQKAILIANDCPFILHSVRKILAQYFDLVHAAENGVEAYQMLIHRPTTFYKAIILDIDMPQMDGIETCKKMMSWLRVNHIVSDPQIFYEHSSSVESSSRRSSQLLAPQLRESSKSQHKKLQNNTPLLYALTQECNQEMIERIYRAGFTDIMSTMTQVKIKMIMESAGLEFVEILRKNRRAMSENVYTDESHESSSICPSFE